MSPVMLLAIVIIFVQLPIWALMIFAPNNPLTHRATDNYLVFVVIGIVYIFLAVAAVTYALSLNSTVQSALASLPSDAAQISADTIKPLVQALNLSANVQPTLLGLLLATGTLDLLGGLMAFREMRAMQISRRTVSIMLVMMFLFGPIGMLIYGMWHQLNKARMVSAVMIDK